MTAQMPHVVVGGLMYCAGTCEGFIQVPLGGGVALCPACQAKWIKDNPPAEPATAITKGSADDQ